MQVDFEPLKRLIRDRGETLAEVAAVIGLSKSKMIRKMEMSGDDEFTHKEIILLALHLNLTQEDIAPYFFTPDFTKSSGEGFLTANT